MLAKVVTLMIKIICHGRCVNTLCMDCTYYCCNISMIDNNLLSACVVIQFPLLLILFSLYSLMLMCVCVYVCECVCVYVCVCVFVRGHACVLCVVYICVHADTCVRYVVWEE